MIMRNRIENLSALPAAVLLEQSDELAIVTIADIRWYPMITAGDIAAVLNQSGDLRLELLFEDFSSFGDLGLIYAAHEGQRPNMILFLLTWA